MNKKLKLLMVFNCISYVIMADIGYLLVYGLFDGLSNTVKFIMGNIPLVLITCTSFILAWDRHKEFRCVKKECIFDWIVRLIAFGVSIEGVKYYKNTSMIFISIASTFIINCIIEFIIYKKVNKNYKMGTIQKELDAEKQEITLEEKNNLEDLKKSY